MKKQSLFSLLLTSSFLWGFYLSNQSIALSCWQTISQEITFNISGIAWLDIANDLSSFVIVHDNKNPAEPRIALIRFSSTNNQATYLPVHWSEVNEIPKDLEAISVVPDTAEPSFMALTSAGKIYHLQLASNQQSISILKVFEIPQSEPNSNLEGFALQKINGLLIAAWGHRGNDEEPGKIYWGIVDLSTYQISQQGSVNVSVPWPLANVRHISDLKIDPAGIIYLSAASDPGETGPFQSALYIAGALSVQENRLNFQPNLSLVPLYRFEDHKVEGFELVPGPNGGIVFGTDDENFGAAVYRTW